MALVIVGAAGSSAALFFVAHPHSAIAKGMRKGRLITWDYDQLLWPEVSEVIMQIIIHPAFIDLPMHIGSGVGGCGILIILIGDRAASLARWAALRIAKVIVPSLTKNNHSNGVTRHTEKVWRVAPEGIHVP